MLSLVLAGALAAATTLDDAERAFAAFQDADDAARRAPSARRLRARDAKAGEALARLEAADAAGIGPEDVRALETMRRALARSGGTDDALAASIYERFGHAAEAIPFEGESLDRLSILGRLAAEPDPKRRKRLFLALSGVWESVAGRRGGASPFAQLVASRREAWARDPAGSPFEGKAREWGLEPAELERWLVRVLEAWRESAGGESPVEPWDWYYAQGAADRALASSLPRDRMVAVATRYFDEMGAAPESLGIVLDIAPRRGKDPVAYTDILRRGRFDRGVWREGRFLVSASYREGGLGNLYELMHELGHGAHLAAIRARPAWNDWPDSDVLTEALADLIGVEAFEPEWQRRILGVAVSTKDALRSRLAGTVMDVAWALFEWRVHREPAADPDAVWTEITSRYLGITPHPELSWWAMRGQLINAPGYMTNYALGAVITEALRERTCALRGAAAFEAPSPALYGWLSWRLYRFGLARPSREVVETFLGAKVGPEPLLATISRAGGPE